jgi:cobalt-zinc-cadmium efflux system membrane fusion protein
MTTSARPAPAQPLSRQRQIVILAAVAIAALALFFGVPLIGKLLTPKPAPPPPPPPAGTFRATEDQWKSLQITTVQATGFVPEAETEGKIATDDDRTTQVFSPFTGRITAVFAKLGDSVRAGGPLFAIDAAEIVQAQSDVATAAAQVRQTAAAQARQQALYKESGAALKDVQQSETDFAAAQAALNAARGRLRVLGQSAAQARAVESGRSGGQTMVTSPISGVVIQRSVGVGQNLASLSNNGGGTPAMTVSDLSKVWLVGNLRESDAPRARIGQRAQVRVEAFPGEVFEGTINYVAPMVDPATHRVVVRAAIDNPGRRLKPEMIATFGLITGEASQGVAVPTDGVIYEGDTARVWVALPGRLLALREIKVGETAHGMVEVTAGLSPGDRVVTGGALFIDRASKGD